MSTLSVNLRKAAKLQDKIEQLEAERDALLGQLGAPTKAAKVDGRKGPRKGGKRRKMSAAARAKMSAARKAFWAKKKAGK